MRLYDAKASLYATLLGALMYKTFGFAPSTKCWEPITGRGWRSNNLLTVLSETKQLDEQ
jgi:hypothetical protein